MAIGRNVAILVWLLAVALFGVRAEPMSTIGDGIEQLDLSASAYRLEDPGGTLSIQQVSQRGSEFRPGEPQIGFSASAWWLRIPVNNNSSRVTWWLDSGTRTAHELDIYVADGAGSYQRQSASANRAFAERPLPTGNFVFPVTLPAGQTTVIYVRARSTGWIGLSLSPQLWKPEALLEVERSREVQWFVYCGIAIGLGMFNLLLYLAIRDSIYFWYVLSLVSMVAVASCGYGSYGLPFKFLWPAHPLFDRLTSIASILASGFFPAMFIQKFIDARNRDPGVHRLLIGLVAVFFATGVARLILTIEPAILPLRLQHQLTALGLAVFAASVLVAAFCVMRLAWKGHRPALMILIAWTPVGLVSLLTSALSIASPLGVLMWASAIEFVLMSLALADRFNQERRSREQAQTALVQGLQQSERELEEKVRTRTLELQDEQRRTTQLLHNMLPVTVAEELSRTGSTRPRRHESVTILFSDFSGFTQSVATMPAHRMVAELNELFSAFDRIADECGVEKIKTIGDAYMAVAGLDADSDDHAQRCVRMGLAMAAFVRERNTTAAFKWEVRVGLHTGPVVSGVVGHRKYAFDIWGDSVNIAARMESSGEIGRVNISAYTFDLVRSEFTCSYRGKVEAKGKGAIDMYFVEGVTPTGANPPIASMAAN